MNYLDYYQILGLTKKASTEEIRKAYRRLARKYHPDVNASNKDSEKKFKEINEANTVLSDPIKRKKYDTYGKDWEQADYFEKTAQQNSRRNASGQRNTGRKFTMNGEEMDPEMFSDFFQTMFSDGELFSQNRSSNGSRNKNFTDDRGIDFKSSLELTLEDVLEDNVQVLEINGKKIRIKIPAGIEDGQTIKIKGQGGQNKPGGPLGDLYLNFKISIHSKFSRTGNDLSCIHDLNLFTALLGGETDINTIYGPVKVKVKPATQSGTKIRLRGKGMPIYKEAGHGDLIVTYAIPIPLIQDAESKSLIEKLKNKIFN